MCWGGGPPEPSLGSSVYFLPGHRLLFRRNSPHAPSQSSVPSSKFPSVKWVHAELCCRAGVRITVISGEDSAERLTHGEDSKCQRRLPSYCGWPGPSTPFSYRAHTSGKPSRGSLCFLITPPRTSWGRCKTVTWNRYHVTPRSQMTFGGDTAFTDEETEAQRGKWPVWGQRS